jgi:hypothetical protein
VEILERYIKEIEEDLKIDEFNIKEASLKSPGRKHFWVSRLIHHKRNLLNLENQRSSLLKDVTRELQAQAIVKLSVPAAEKAVLQSQPIKDLQTKINEEKLIIEFLEKTEKTFSSLTYDIKNIVEIMKLEQL